MRRVRFSNPVSVAFVVVLLSSCTIVPSIEETTGARDSKLFINDVVTRVKCELASAYGDKSIQDKYLWLKDWTVKTDLSLQINEQGGITPTLSYTQFQRSAVNVGAGPATTTSSALGLVQQSFTTAVNANVGAQMTAIQAESFTISVAELAAFRKSAEYFKMCKPAEDIGLLGNLRLKEWADASLSPVGSVLFAGKHKAPGTASATKPQVTPKPTAITGNPALTAEKILEFKNSAQPKSLDSEQNKKLDDLVALATEANQETIANHDAVNKAYNQIKGNLEKANDELTNYTPIATGPALKTLRDQVATFRKLLKNAQSAKDCVLQQACGNAYGDCSKFLGAPVERWRQRWEIDDQCRALTCASSPGDPQNGGKAYDESKNYGSMQEKACALTGRDEARRFPILYSEELGFVRDSADSAKTNQANSKTLADYTQGLAQQAPTQPDAPVDSISTTIQFEVAMGAGVTPSWSLIYFKGPGINSPFVAATLNRTHILQVALGAPSASTNSGLEQSRVLQNGVFLLLPH
ncbi:MULTISPECIES: hypothetical protein [Bradyrhizobium]|jgi:hypothetical protein|nr:MULTISPECIES: hypothetical protein [Bradyrhizobium]MBK5655839.1 hypothetical protein [Rhizobium sp.]